MKQSIDIHYGSDDITVMIGNKRFYDSGGLVEFVDVFQRVLIELGYDVKAYEVY